MPFRRLGFNNQIQMSNSLTKIPASHRNEWKSKRKFEEIIDPWYLPFEWTVRDYGIDGQVEITRPIGKTSDVEPQGLYFLVQLKCIEKLSKPKKRIGYSIPVKKIIQWYGSNLPVLLALYDMEEGQFHSLWINDQLIGSLDSHNPKWITKATVTIKITSENDVPLTNLPAIRDYVTSWKRTPRRIIEPGLYFDLKNKCEHLNICFGEIAAPFQFESISQRVGILGTQINEAIYRLAITGPSRSGKSSLINAMLGKKGVSPTGIFQTTGVPIQILPGNNEEIQVLFQDGKLQQHPFSEKAIRKFASQDENINNEKKVSLVTIFTQNRELEKGIALFDIPGLDDPVESIYEHAWMILRKSNAIFYLIDASVAANGGFVFRADYKNEILELSQQLDKIFLVFNKINALTPDRSIELKQKVANDLKRLDLFNKVAEKIYFISAEESLSLRLKKSKKSDSLTQLESDLWQYLLKENKIGLRRLSATLESLINGLNDFAGLLNTRLLDLSTKRNLITALQEIENKVSGLSNIFHKERNRSLQSIRTHLENQKNRILENLEKQLNEIPQQNDLPTKQNIKDYLATSVKSTLETTNQLYSQNANSLNSSVRLWIESNFQKIWEIVARNQDQRNVDLTEFESIEVPEIDFSNSLGVGAVTWLITTVLAPGYALAVGFVGFFSNLLLTVEERRTKRIKKLMDQVKEKLNEIYKRMESGYTEAFGEWSEHTRVQVNKAIVLFISDLRQQIEKIDIPISLDEDKKYTKGLAQIDDLKVKVVELNKELLSWHSSL